MSNIAVNAQRLDALAQGNGPLAGLARLALLALRVGEERRQLAELEDWQLVDLGLTRTAAEAESRRSIADLPAHRKTGLYL